MAWKHTGVERMRRFAAYRDLEAQLEALRNDIRTLQAELAAKDASIRTLARELAASGLGEASFPERSVEASSGPTEVVSVPDITEAQTTPEERPKTDSERPKRRESGTQPAMGKVPLSKLFGDKTGEKGK